VLNFRCPVSAEGKIGGNWCETHWWGYASE
jgi:hypothetical protein